MKKKHPTLADIRIAMLRFLLLPEQYEDFTPDDRDFIRSDIVGQLLKYPEAFGWIAFWRKNSEA